MLTSTVEVMLLADVSTWFLDAAGNALDPSNPADADAIADQIRDSFRAFGR